MAKRTRLGFIVLGALAVATIFCYVATVARRRPLHQEQVLIEKARVPLRAVDVRVGEVT